MRVPILRSPTLLGLTVALTGCGLLGGPETPDVPMIDRLQGTWAAQDLPIPAGARRPTFTVDTDGRVGGDSGINRYTGVLDLQALARGELVLGPLAGTRMAGPPASMQLEREFLQRLETANRIELVDGELRLLRDDELALRFAQIED